MKKIYYMLYMLVAFSLAVFSLTSCSNEQDHLFDDSSSNRVDAGIKETNTILVGADKGWRMEYFLDGYLTYGGYNTLLKFNDDGTVTAASEIFASDFVATSLYSISQSAGIALSIDTYNEVFSAFSDPGAPLGGGVGDGMGGENDFLVISVTKDKVLLKGKKSGVILMLTPMTEEWNIFLESINTSRNNLLAPTYEIKKGEETLIVSPSNNTLDITYQENDVAITISAPYILNAESFTFYEPINILGATISGFNYVESTDSFTAIGDEAITLIKIIPPLNEQFVSGDWFIAFSDLGPMAQYYFDFVKVNALDAMLGEVLEYAFMGSLLYGEFGFNFRSSGYAGLLNYNHTLIDEDQITLQHTGDGDGNGPWYYKNAGFSYLLLPFGDESAVTFTLTTDNKVSPSYILLTDNSDPDNWMKLHRAQIFFPFDN